MERTARLLPLAALFLLSCHTNDSTEPLQTATANARVSGEIHMAQQNVVVSGNRIGPVIIAGEALDSTVRWFTDRYVTGPSLEEANAQLSAITVEGNTNADSLVVSVVAPANTKDFTYSCGLSLSIPYDMPCVITKVLGTTTITQLNSTATVYGGGAVTLSQHAGSCTIDTPSGDLTLSMVIPDTGHCYASTGQGNILLQIPVTTSAKVYAKTGNGTITVTGLMITPVAQDPALLEGTLGTGTGNIRIETAAGDIILRAF
jgi:hypothetical protein